MSQARAIHPGTTYLITRRTERRHCLLRPDSAMNAFILYAFIVSAHRHNIQIHAFCAMSTHLHYVVSDPLGKLPKFLGMFHRLVALGTKIIREWDGAVWDRSQTSVVQLCTRQAVVEKIAYTLANPVEAGLVWEAHEWPGVKTTINDIGQSQICARRPNHYFRAQKKEWVVNAQFEVTLPPWIDAKDADVFRDDIRTELNRLENAAHEKIPRHKVLGAKRVMKVSPERRIMSRETVGQLNPTFALGTGATKAAQLEAMAKVRAFRASYRIAMSKWRAGDRSVAFPAGTYAMRVVHGVNVAC